MKLINMPRLMEGVRRWMGAHPSSSPQKIHGKAVSRVNVKSTLAEPEMNPHSTEVIARQLLDPAVSEEEEEEYQGCV
jgi:phosphatidylinositol 3,5-bisphosphate 5-phosphatase